VRELKQAGAAFGQGFFFGKAMPAEAVDKYVNDETGRRHTA